MLQVQQLDIILFQPGLLQRAQGEQIRIGAFGGGYFLAFELGNRLQGRILAHHQCCPFRPAVDIHRLDRAAVGPGQHRRQAGRRSEVDAATVQVLQRAVAALAQHPGDFRLRQGFLQPAKMLEREADRRIVGVVQADFGRCGLGGLRCAVEAKRQYAGACHAANQRAGRQQPKRNGGLWHSGVQVRKTRAAATD